MIFSKQKYLNLDLRTINYIMLRLPNFHYNFFCINLFGFTVRALLIKSWINDMYDIPVMRNIINSNFGS